MLIRLSQRKWRCLKGAVLNIKFGPFSIFSGVFFTLPRYDYPFDATLVLVSEEATVLCKHATLVLVSEEATVLCKQKKNTFGLWCHPICALNIAN